MRPLNKKEQIFIDEYIIHNNATLAYTTAYGQIKNAGEMGYRMLKKEKIKTIIDEKKAEIAKQYNITQDFLIKELLDIIQSCKEAKKELGTADRNNWNKAVQTLAKITGHDIQKIEVKDNTTRITVVTDYFEKLENAEIQDVKFEETKPKQIENKSIIKIKIKEDNGEE